VFYFQATSLTNIFYINNFLKGDFNMADTSRRVPLWLIATVGGLAVLTVLGLFLFGSYSGLGSSI